jgi:hypothetical protein
LAVVSSTICAGRKERILFMAQGYRATCRSPRKRHEVVLLPGRVRKFLVAKCTTSMRSNIALSRSATRILIVNSLILVNTLTSKILDLMQDRRNYGVGGTQGFGCTARRKGLQEKCLSKDRRAGPVCHALGDLRDARIPFRTPMVVFDMSSSPDAQNRAHP